MLRQKHNGSIAEMGEQIDTLNKVKQTKILSSLSNFFILILFCLGQSQDGEGTEWCCSRVGGVSTAVEQRPEREDVAGEARKDHPAANLRRSRSARGAAGLNMNV